VRSYLDVLERIFSSSRDRHEAHRASIPLLTELSSDASYLSHCLERYVTTVGALNTRHYPVLAVPIGRTQNFELVANCWIPLPGGETNLSTKSIHHHGQMLLTTVTGFGPGYEHWLFSAPRQVDSEFFDTQLLDRNSLVPHKPAFVDARVAHVPFYPRSLSITFALWSHSQNASWVDAVKQWELIQRYRGSLRGMADTLGLTSALKINPLEYLDFFPVEGKLKVIKERVEFRLGPNQNFLHSLFHVIQQTGNARLGRLMLNELERQREIENRPLIERLVQRLERGEPIEGRLSDGHYDVPFANFTREAVERVVVRS
jgi:hypothetical protein